ncbi:hypothetical protein BO86DRAFT_437624 [Aspergillus japonicus CBS 114.51]|uniref:Zn(2)-C6 fungal-type domain-containing protein n=1 Tax=Aspergillus japonicus CBS 114.51 TaxID=1448312 RepID=A0A8T8WUA3_ASPJA|nr:hypothetical protein BO86DRAFT_437624 [Aspergillus japonicus CBS 114.51]RAH78909.1 hypothetical protein BO86DRAFT_437624 [Aspergillus japonicus CBS 114.51]
MSSQTHSARADQERISRNKRAPYIQRACLTCKRRKQRCSGDDPCKHCESRGVTCQYDLEPVARHLPPDYQGTLSSQVHRLSEVVESLQAEVQSLKGSINHGASAATGKQRTPDTPASEECSEPDSKRRRFVTTMVVSPPSTVGPRYQGLTSPEYSFELASLKLAHLQDPTAVPASHLDAFYNREDERQGRTRSIREGEPDGPAALSKAHIQPEHTSVRVFLDIPYTEAKRLVVSYSNTVGLLHPVVDVSVILSRLDALYARLKDTRQSTRSQPALYDVIVIRLILSIALRMEENQQTELIASCFEGVEDELNRILASEHISLRGVILVLLGVGPPCTPSLDFWTVTETDEQALYHLFSGSLRMAWRLGGVAASLALELGLHRPMTLQKAFGDEGEQVKAMTLMWSIFVLDHEWSTALGLPHHMDDGSLVPAQLHPVKTQYLKAMMSYCVISSKIVNATAGLPVNPDLYDDEQFQFINYQIDRWQQSAIAKVQSLSSPVPSVPSRPDKASDFIQTMLSLRANQLRILMLRPLFFQDSPVKPSQAQISQAIDTAVQTISILKQFDAQTDLYRRLHALFSQFIASAAALILLSITYTYSAPLDSTSKTGFSSSITRDVCVPLKDVLKLTDACSGLSPACAQVHCRLQHILGILVRLQFISIDGISAAPTEGPVNPTSLQNSESSMIPNFADPTGGDPSEWTLPSPQGADHGGSDQADLLFDWAPLASDNDPPLDQLLDGTIWTELNKLLRPHLQPESGLSEFTSSHPLSSSRSQN